MEGGEGGTREREGEGGREGGKKGGREGGMEGGMEGGWREGGRDGGGREGKERDADWNEHTLLYLNQNSNVKVLRSWKHHVTKLCWHAAKTMGHCSRNFPTCT